MKYTTLLLFALALLSCNGQTQTQQQSTSLTADECANNNESVACCFINMPAKIYSSVTLAGESEPGECLILYGQILKKDGNAYPGVIVYAYHTDHTGIYSKSGKEQGIQKWHGRLHGWCITDSEGRYEIHTIRPAPYPNSKGPAHIHCVVKEPGGEVYYINDVVFADDLGVDEKYLSLISKRWDDGIVTLTGKEKGVWEGRRVTVLE